MDGISPDGQTRGLSDSQEAVGGQTTVTLKLYAQLGPYLPEGAQKNQADVVVKPGTTIRALLDAYQVPPEMCHLVLVNGIYKSPPARESEVLKAGDAVAVWPPVAGG